MAHLEQLKANLVAVVTVMLAVLFLGAAAADRERGLDLLAYGGGIALVILFYTGAESLGTDKELKPCQGERI